MTLPAIPSIEHAVDQGNYYVYIVGFGNQGDLCPDFFAAICEHLDYHKNKEKRNERLPNRLD